MWFISKAENQSNNYNRLIWGYLVMCFLSLGYFSFCMGPKALDGLEHGELLIAAAIWPIVLPIFVGLQLHGYYYKLPVQN